MSYEQKYLKYKQKYQELKNMLGGGSIHKLETDNYTDINEFNLTDTPTSFDKPSFIGGTTENEEMEFNLTETPTEYIQSKQNGGAPLVPFDYISSIPLSTCAGQVNPMPDVSVPLPAQTPPAVIATQNKNYVNNEEINTTTELSDVKNTEDIVKLFKQFGGKHTKSSSSSSSSSTDTSDISTSDSF